MLKYILGIVSGVSICIATTGFVPLENITGLVENRQFVGIYAIIVFLCVNLIATADWDLIKRQLF